MKMIAGIQAWDYAQLEWHRCPCCGTECPPRPPVHGPRRYEILKAWHQKLRETEHSPSCPMYGHTGGSMGYSGPNGSASCDCYCRVMYRQIYAYEHPPEPEEE